MSAILIPDFSLANPNIDLTTLSTVQAWMAVGGSTGSGASSAQGQNPDSPSIQLCITAASIEFVRRTGRFSPGGVNAWSTPAVWVGGATYPTGVEVLDPSAHIQLAIIGGVAGATAPAWNDSTGQTSDGSVLWQDLGLQYVSPFLQPQQFNENYNGNNNQQLFLDNWPIFSIQALSIQGVALPPSTGPGSGGYFIHQDKRSIMLRQGVVFTPANYNPAGAGDFNAWQPGGGAGWCFINDHYNPQGINVQYTAGFNACPPDVERAVLKMVMLNVKSRQFVGQRSKSVSGQSSSFDWNISPDVLDTMASYMLRAR